MLDNIIDRLKQFEVILKKCILDRFGNSLPENKKTLLNNTNYVDNNVMAGLKTGNEIQGRILRHMLNSLIDFKVNKNFILSDGSSINISYGEDIEKEIIELFATEVAQKYKFNIDFTTLSLDKAKTIKSILGDAFDFNVLNLNAEIVLENPNLSSFTQNYNDDIFRKYDNTSLLINNNFELESQLIDNNLETIDLSNSSTEITSDYEEVVTNKEEIVENESILTEEEYQQLCMKYARNEELTQDEFNKLLKATPDLLSNGNVEEFAGHNVNVLSNEAANKMELGYTSPSLALYLFSVFIALLIFLGIILF